MNLSHNRLSVITLFAEHLALAKSFYRDVFGLQVLFDGERQVVFRLQTDRSKVTIAAIEQKTTQVAAHYTPIKANPPLRNQPSREALYGTQQIGDLGQSKQLLDTRRHHAASPVAE